MYYLLTNLLAQFNVLTKIMLLQRYGWQGVEDAALQANFDAAAPSYAWINDYRDRSVTELEFLHGHLRQLGSLPAFIAFRDKVSE